MEQRILVAKLLLEEKKSQLKISNLLEASKGAVEKATRRIKNNVSVVLKNEEHKSCTNAAQRPNFYNQV